MTAEEFLKERYIEEGTTVKSVIPGISTGYFNLVDLLQEYSQQNPTEEVREESIRKLFNERDSDGSYYEILKYRKDRLGIDNLSVPYDASEELAKAIIKLLR